MSAYGLRHRAVLLANRSAHLQRAETAHLADDRIRLPALRPRRECFGDIAVTLIGGASAEARACNRPGAGVSRGFELVPAAVPDEECRVRREDAARLLLPRD
jgi:hypothetical protein